MARESSVRSRVLFGAIFWTVGLFLIGGALLTHLMESNPNAPAAFHHFFLSTRPISLLAIIFLFLGLTQLRRGVSPMAQLRHRLSSVHTGQSRRIDGTFPSEVQPLVDDLNTLIEERDASIARAQAKAGDLAHGLKTPLAILLQEAEAAGRAGQTALADGIKAQVEHMRRQMDYHLAGARAAASSARPGTRCAVAPAVDGLIRTLRRLYAERHLTFTVAVPADAGVRVERIDLEEMLGNLLDNACKWGRTTVSLTASTSTDSVVITVEDDGPGVADDQRERVLQRGVRADETAPGSGFGLAIVGDLADAYGGTITLDRSPLGGLRARLTLPAAVA